jgi:hypothetical protein
VPVKLTAPLLVAFSLILLAARAAAAQPAQPVTEKDVLAAIELQPEPDSVPGTLCLVMRRPEKLGEAIELSALTKHGKKVGRGYRFREPIAEEATATLGSAKTAASKLVFVKPQPAPGCTDAGDACAPELDVDEKALGRDLKSDLVAVWCTENKAAGLAGGPVVFVFIDFHLFTAELYHPKIKRLYFQGTVASIDLALPKTQELALFTARVVGGEFAESDRNALGV